MDSHEGALVGYPITSLIHASPTLIISINEGWVAAFGGAAAFFVDDALLEDDMVMNAGL